MVERSEEHRASQGSESPGDLVWGKNGLSMALAELPRLPPLRFRGACQRVCRDGGRLLALCVLPPRRRSIADWASLHGAPRDPELPGAYGRSARGTGLRAGALRATRDRTARTSVAETPARACGSRSAEQRGAHWTPPPPLLPCRRNRDP